MARFGAALAGGRTLAVLKNGGTGSLFGLAWQPGLAAELGEAAVADAATGRP